MWFFIISYFEHKSTIIYRIYRKKVYGEYRKINFCLGCNTCQRNGGTCVYKDGVPEILDKMLDYDVIVLATPVYIYSITGQFKTLIDRTYSKFSSLSNKEFYFILSCVVPYEKPYKNDLDIAINSLR